MKFKCPTCGCLFYDQFIASRPGGKSVRTELHFCLGCTTVFLEPELYSSAPEFRKSAPAELPPMLHEHGSMQRDLATRYWAARAKREGGGAEPDNQTVRRLRSSLER